jgi:sec-independent protein translocase protein TatB
MFDIGFAELLIIGVVGLVVLGPDKMPVAARTVGLWVGKARRTISGIQSEINEELRLDEMKRQVAMQKEDLDKELNEMREPFSETLDSNSPVANSVAKPAVQNDSNDSAVAGGSQESKPKADD